MSVSKTRFLFLNIGHFIDHWFMLIFATVAAVHLAGEWNMGYGELIPYATPGFIAFGACALAAGWLADKWRRDGMMVVFFIGIGISACLSGLATSPLQLGIGLTLVGIFAAIYHPVGLAMVVEGRERTGIPLAINGVFGNMGVACAALVTGFLIDVLGWRSAFVAPGGLAIALGLAYLRFERRAARASAEADASDRDRGGKPAPPANRYPRELLVRVFSIVFFSTALGGLIFQSTTFSLPKVIEEMLGGSASTIGGYAFVVFSVAALAQIVVGYLVDRHSVRRIFAAVALLQALFFLAMTRVDGVAALLVATGFMLAVFGQIPINDVLVGRAARSEWRSRAYALRYVITFSVMASAVPVIAWMHGKTGFNGIFMLLAVSAALIFCAVLLLPGESAAPAQESTSRA